MTQDKSLTPSGRGPGYYVAKTIQPRDVALAWNLEYEACLAIKYIARYREKGGAEDIRKAIHCLELLEARL